MTLDTATLKATWAIVAAHGAEPARDFYSLIFRDHPAVRPMFPAGMAGQNDKLLSALGAVISNVDHLDAVVPVLQQLGRDHRKFGVVEDLYRPVGEALLATLAMHLGDQWTPDVEDVWKQAYGTVAAVMVGAALEAEEAGEPPWWDARIVTADRYPDRPGQVDLALIVLDHPYPWKPGQRITFTHHAEPGHWLTVEPSDVWDPAQPTEPVQIELTVYAIPGDPITRGIAAAAFPGQTVRLGPPLDPHPRETTNQETAP